jgi:galactokinase
MRTVAPGRVNLIGDHTDYTGGLVFPMAIDRWTILDGDITDDVISLTSADQEGTVQFPLDAPFDSSMQPSWGRYVSAVASLVKPQHGVNGHLTTTIPVGAGLSSSAALELAIAYALTDSLPATELALFMQKAEQLATGVPTGIMDQLCIASAQEGHGTLIDCHSLEVQHIAIPTDIEVVVQFIAHRTLEGSEYSDRVRECAEAEQLIGALRDADQAAVDSITDETIKRRARHVVSENQRVRDFTAALTAGDYRSAGALMTQSHRSLSTDFGVSTQQMDQVVESICAIPGVYGSRMTGGGFGGCIVTMSEPGTELDGWKVKPVGAARRVG